ncbi:MAG: glycosyltransferase family 2 protein [Deltaproteobacteria bacterium]|nr:glycosyltransferase family 2 protein [Deltaproteobacteria bacterium]
MQTVTGHKTLILIPAFNEQDHIAGVIRQAKDVDKDLDILIVDDGSKDKTADLSRHSGAKLIRLSSHMGYGVALQTGYKYAYENGYDFLVQLDGDGQHDPADIPRLLDVVVSGDAELALGSRFMKDTPRADSCRKRHRPSISRKLGTRVFALLTTLLTGFKITDPTSGYQAFGRRVIEFFVRDFFPCDYPDADIILMAHRAGFKIKEVPIVAYKRNDGKSMHRGLKPVYYTFKMFLSIFMTMIRRKPRFLRMQKAFERQLPES